MTGLIKKLPYEIIDQTIIFYRSKKKQKALSRIALLESYLKGGNVEKVSSSSFSHLNRRVRRDLYNTMMLQNENWLYKDLFAQNELKVNRAIIISKFLVTLGLYSDAKSLMSKSLVLAKKYELLDEHIRLMEMERAFFAFRDKSFNHERLLEELRLTRFLRDDFVKASDAYYLALVDKNFFDKAVKDRIYKQLLVLKEIYFRTSLSRVGLMYYIVSIRYYDNIKQYSKAFSLALEAKELITQSVVLSSKANISRIYGELAQYYLMFKDYEMSKESALLSYEYSNSKRQSGLMAIESLFKVALFTDRYDDSREVLSQGLKHPIVKKNIAFRARWSYYEACQLFSEKKYIAVKRVIRIHLEKKGVSFDKEGWGFGVRLLEVMSSFEQQKISEFEKSLRNLKDSLIGNEISARAKCILKSLECLKEDKLLTNKSRFLEMIDQLKRPEAKWDPLCFELINFTAWLEGKLKPPH
jgi:hypothetical protein